MLSKQMFVAFASGCTIMLFEDKEIIDEIIVTEGEYSNYPEDKGGPTKYGVTQKTLSAWLGRPASVQEVKDLKIEVARNILYNLYFLQPGYDRFQPIDLRHLLVDISINSGPARANRLLQQALLLGLPEGRRLLADGVLGPRTMEAYRDVVRLRGLRWLIDTITDERIVFLTEIVVSNPKQIKFLRGWIKRALSFREVV